MTDHSHEHDPMWDGTDAACACWCRGNDHATAAVTEIIRKALDGQDDGSGVIGYGPLEQVRRLILKSRGTVGRLLVAKARAEAAAAELAVLRQRGGS